MGIKKIWNDPVWSKVISAAIIGAGLGIWSVFKSLSQKISFGQAFKDIINIKVSLGIIVLFLLVILIGVLLLRIKKSKVKQKFTNAQQNVLRMTHMVSEDQILVLFNVNYNEEMRVPLASNIKTYCNLHKPASPTMEGRCSDPNCKNHWANVRPTEIKSYVNAMLFREWTTLA